MNQITYSISLSFPLFQDAISTCMDQIEVSMSLSMSGESFQPSTAPSSSTDVTPVTNPVVAPPTQSLPKVIPQQPSSSGYFQSTTPTDLMEVSQTCVC